MKCLRIFGLTVGLGAFYRSRGLRTLGGWFRQWDQVLRGTAVACKKQRNSCVRVSTWLEALLFVFLLAPPPPQLFVCCACLQPHSSTTVLVCQLLILYTVERDSGGGARKARVATDGVSTRTE